MGSFSKDKYLCWPSSCTSTFAARPSYNYRCLAGHTEEYMSGHACCQISRDVKEPDNVKEFREWFRKGGGYIHDAVYFEANPTGMSVKTGKDLPSSTPIISCPFSLVITDELARKALAGIFSLDASVMCALSERQAICAYVSLHWIIPSEARDIGRYLEHMRYISILPPSTASLTPPFFNPIELALFEGTNLHAATLALIRSWKDEWSRLREVLSSAPTQVHLIEQFAWEFYLAAGTYLTSRAFPSTILSESPSLIATPSSSPVLIPGVDSLNHRRAQVVTWSVDNVKAVPSSVESNSTLQTTHKSGSHSALSLTLILDNPQTAGSELFNNYGPKPNGSLILAYGFSIPENPDDTILLSIGMGSTSENQPGGSRGGHEIGRHARGADKLWEDVKQRIARADRDDDNYVFPGGDAQEEDAEMARIVRSLDLDMQTAAALGGMIFQRQAKLPPMSTAPSPPYCVDGTTTMPAVPFGVRPAVYAMWANYVRGQQQVLEDLLRWVQEKDQEAMRKAQEMGVVVEDEDEDQEEE